MAKYVCILHFTSPKHEIDTHAEVAVTAEGQRDTLFQAKIPGKSLKKLYKYSYMFLATYLNSFR